jgi:hypothetical protein
VKALRLFAIELLTFALVFVPRQWRELREDRSDYLSAEWRHERMRSRGL